MINGIVGSLVPTPRSSTAAMAATTHGDASIRPSKRLKMLSDDERSSNSGSESSEDQASDVPALSINAEYAQRFEHNKKRDELQRRKSNCKIKRFTNELTNFS